ncbi:MAG: GntR family transcriptional regulator [Planctomycetota bacterium]|jgi:GntR family transcriptional regulator
MSQLSVFEIDKKSEEPAYLQLKQQIVAKINSGQFGPGHKLPSIRKISDMTGIACNTAMRAVNELVQESFVVSKVGIGNIVAERKCNLIGITGSFQEQTFFHDNFYIGLMQGIHKVIDSHDTAFIFKQAKEGVSGVFKNTRPDGLIVLGRTGCRKYEAENKDNPGMTSAVLLGGKSTAPEITSVDSNSFKASFDSVKMLLEKGYKRIAGCFVNRRSDSERLSGYINALDLFGIPVDDKLVYFMEDFDEHDSSGQLYDAQPDAFFAPKSRAAGKLVTPAIAKLCNNGKRPAVVTFDPQAFENIIGRYSLPNILISQPLEEMGAKAAERLIALVEGKSKIPEKIKLDVSFTDNL